MIVSEIRIYHASWSLLLTYLKDLPWTWYRVTFTDNTDNNYNYYSHKNHDHVYGEGNRKKFVGAEEYIYTFLYEALHFNEWPSIRHPVDELQSLQTAELLDQ